MEPEAPTAPAAQPAAPTTTVTAPTAPAPATDPAAEIARLQAEIDTWKGHSRKWEARATAKTDADAAAATRDAALAKVAEALGLDAAVTKPDPEAIARQLQATQAEAKARAVEVAVLRAAQSAGADGDALLDSKAFAAKVANIDPADADAVKAVVAAAVAANPRYATAQQQAAAAPPPQRQASTGGQFDGAPGTSNQQLGEADWKRMSPAEIAKASREGRFNDYLNSPN